MNILMNPAEYAALLRNCYAQSDWGIAAFDACRAKPDVPLIYWAAVHLEMLKPQPLADILTEEEK